MPASPWATERGHAAPAIAAVAVCERAGKLLILREERGAVSLPERLVGLRERVEDACLSAARDASGAEAADPRLLGVWSDPARDPRGHVVAVAYAVDVRETGAGSWIPLAEAKGLSRGHDAIVDAWRRRRSP